MHNKQKEIKNKWYQRKNVKVIAMTFVVILLYQFLTSKKKEVENKLPIGGPNVEIKQPYLTNKTPVPTTNSSLTADSTIEEVSFTDSNVVKAYRNTSWKVMPTSQAEPHVMTFNEGSKDRLEIRQAIRQATEISEQELEEWWIGANGDDQVVATVSHIDSTNPYRVTLQWRTNKGWQTTLLEELKTLPTHFQ